MGIMESVMGEGKGEEEPRSYLLGFIVYESTSKILLTAGVVSNKL